MRDDNVRVHRIVDILFSFDHIWVFVLHATLSSDIPVPLLNQSIDTQRTKFLRFVRQQQQLSMQKLYYE